MRYLLVIIFFSQVSLLLGFSSRLLVRESFSKASLKMKSSNSFSVNAKHFVGLISLVQALSVAHPSIAVTPLEYVNPKDAVLLNDASSSTKVQAGREGLKTLIEKIEGIKMDLSKDTQVEITKRIQSDFRLDAVRDVLNQFNGAFSEDTQRGSDRLIRLFLQDVTNLEKEGLVREGKQRSETRAKNLLRTLDKAEMTLKELQSFYP